MSNMEIKNNAFAFEQTIENSGDLTAVLNTENKFIDKNIGIKITTPAVGNLTLALTDKDGELSMGSASEGVYSPVISLNGTVTPATAGWIAASATNVSDNSVAIGTVNQSTLSVGGSTISSGDTVNPAASAQTVTISEGYNGARTVVIGAASAGPAGSVSSPSNVAPTFGAPTYNNSGENEGRFTIAATGTIAAPTVDVDGYVSETIGTKTAGSISGTKVLDTITLGANITPPSAITPTISKQSISISGVTDAASGAATTTTPSSGVYVKVKSAGTTATVTAVGTVAAGGYGTTTNYNEGDADSDTITVNDSADTYIPITQASTYTATIGTVTGSDIAVGSESSNTYPVTANLSIPATVTAGTDGWFHSGTATGSASSVAIGSLPKATFSVDGDDVVSTTAGYIAAGATVGSVDAGTLSIVTTDPGNGYSENTTAVLVDGGYLTLTAGYYPATKISTATLVPDGTDISGHADYILYGHTALDEDGVLVTGSIPTYDGSYTIS